MQINAPMLHLLCLHKNAYVLDVSCGIKEQMTSSLKFQIRTIFHFSAIWRVKNLLLSFMSTTTFAKCPSKKKYFYLILYLRNKLELMNISAFLVVFFILVCQEKFVGEVLFYLEPNLCTF